ncbi:MAG: hypothetical protein FJZ90_15235, partial [Chloroflexi bacterium]|nr:hypothetical protein [Chloroflexota bacterium]
VAITRLTRLTTADADASALMRVRRTGEGLMTLLLFGDASLSGSSMQSGVYTLSADGDDYVCTDTPPGLMVQTQSGQTGTVWVNGVKIELSSTAYVTLQDAPPTAGTGERRFTLVDRGVSGIGPSTPVIKGQVYDRNGNLLRNGRAKVGVSVDGAIYSSGTFPNPFPTNADGWYEIYVGRGQTIRIVKLLIDGREVVPTNAHLSWKAEGHRWWYVDIREGAPGAGSPVDAEMIVANVEGSVRVQGRPLAVGRQLRIPLYGGSPAPGQAVREEGGYALTVLPLIRWLALDPAGLPQLTGACGGAIEVGQTVEGRIAQQGGRCEYTFRAQSGERVTIRMDWRTDSLDPRLDLIDPAGRVVASDDDSGGNRNSLIENLTLTQAGTYTIVARGSGYYGAGLFRLTLTGQPACTYAAHFVRDQTIPDGTRLASGAKFTKEWQVRNSGTCAWPAGTTLRFVSGARMSGPASLAVASVASGSMATVGVDLVAPLAAGTYRGYWRLHGPDGAALGSSFYVEIVVQAAATPTATPTVTRTRTPTPTRTSSPPTVRIVYPAADIAHGNNNYAYDGYDAERRLWYKDVTLVAEATDPDDGPLGGSSVVWMTDRTDIHGDPILGEGSRVTVRLYSNECEGVGHVITVIATDSSGRSARAQRAIDIWTLC